MPRFVLLRHECPHDFPKPSHWDFMLEQEGVLLTWELRELPSTWSDSENKEGTTVPASRLPDHRIAYLDYEGPVSNNRGTVSRLDQGTFEILQQDASLWEVLVKGSRLCGRILLEASGESWKLTTLPC